MCASGALDQGSRKGEVTSPLQNHKKAIIMKYLIIIAIIPTLLLAQDFEFQLETDSIQVEIDGWTPFCPWAGGESESCPEFADIDADGDLDCFIGNFGGKISYFENKGIQSSPDYSFISWDFINIDLGNFYFGGRTSPEFADIDNDSDLDLFSGDFMGLIHFWENIGTISNPVYELVTDTLEGIDADGYSKIQFIDIDFDDDYDIILGDYYGRVWLHTNTGSSSIFNFSTAPLWIQNIDVGSNASPGLVDIDSDNDYDLFIGERYGTIWYYRNDGDSANYDFTLVTDFFDSIDVGEYSSPEFADIDCDGDYDLFVGKDANTSEMLGDIYYYKNIGTPEIPEFELTARNYLMMDVGWLPKSQMVDIDEDGFKDLFVSTGYYINYFSNTGSVTQPYFTLVDTQFQDIYESGISPFFVDIDADGDFDLISGEGAIPGPPSIALYINEGTPRNPNLQLYNPSFVTNPDFVVWILPALADIDTDGDYDLFIFDSDNHFYYYLNEGTPQWPDFTLITNQWQGIHQFPPPQDGWYGFAFADLDEDLDIDLLIESPEQNNMYFYRNQGNPQNPVMVLEDEQFLDQDYRAIYTPHLVDIDSDDDYDLYIGHANGGMLFFRNITDEPPGVQPKIKHPQFGLEFTFGPNPANPTTWVTFNLPYPQKAELAVYNLLGQKVATLAQGLQPPGSHTYFWNASDFSSGVYLVMLSTMSGSGTTPTTETKRVVVLK